MSKQLGSEEAENIDAQGLKENNTSEFEQTESGTDTRPLKEIVFEICENLYRDSKNIPSITRKLVRQRAGRGSDRDLSKYINDWKESKALVVQQPNSQAVAGTNNGTEVRAQPINDAFMPDNDMANLVRGGAESAAGMLIANSAIATHFYMNPDKLPDDLKEQVQEATENFTQSRANYNRSIFDPQKLIDQAMERIG
ncbi:DNA-binding protein [Anabaena cylindrica UHCC 0172]|uniref:DNA-binding protein n=1 Tax=Anabaena cylindrica TaxID=1165 RepID=UPI002B1FF06A|nr:DNA-binding protein [Anabaena cylindrica]MEA5553331.1 DNA-binding protein [Anabaena cylindrica UHCC 0172]